MVHDAAPAPDPHRELERLRAQLDLREQELTVTIDHSPIGLSVVDNDDRMVRVNEALCRFLGYDEAALLEHSWKELTHPADLMVGAEEIAALFAGERSSFSVEKRYLRSDGEVVWALVNVSLLRDASGEPLYRVTQHVDITAQKEREGQLERFATAERSVARELRHLHTLKSTFLDAVSHELRTPLTVIRGMAETLRHRRGSLAPSDRARIEDALLIQTQRLSDLLDDLLELERLERDGDPLSHRPVDAVAVARRAIAASTIAPRTELIAPGELTVRSDPHRLELIIANLLSNAAKYAQGSSVTVRLSNEGYEGMRLEVVDRGPGIPRTERAAVFEPFHRAVPDHPSPGTGIGLSLVARFARLHGGDAWVEDAEVGAHLVVTLPSPRPPDTDP